MVDRQGRSGSAGDPSARRSLEEWSTPSTAADEAGGGGLARVLVDLAVRLGTASGRDDVLQAGRAALATALPEGATWTFSLPMAEPAPRPDGADIGAARVGEGVFIYTDRTRLTGHFPDLARRLPRASAAWFAVPLTAGADQLGLLGVAWPERQAPDDDIHEFLATLACLVSQSLRSVEVHTRDQQLTRQLQRSLLPVVAPIDGLDIEYRYQPAGEDALAGGDFYDVVELGSGVTAVVIGDVAGHGVDAATASGEVRYLVRGVLEHTRHPSEVLCLVDSALGRGGRAPTMVTLLCAVLDTPANVLRMASAGHCPPIIRTASGAVSRAAIRPSPPLGAGFVRADDPPVETVVPFGAGDVAVLYTDGLVERRATALDPILSAVEAVVARHREPAALCTHLAEFAAAGRDHDDDLALLVVRRHGPAPLGGFVRVPPRVERV